MSALEKTKSLQRLDYVPFALIDSQENNPNEMSDAEFNLLYDNMETTGFTDPLLLRLKPDGRYSLIGGHHRMAVARLHEFDGGPATVITDPEFDADLEKFQVVRMNMIRGKLNPKKFFSLYQTLDKKYEADIMAQAFGFTDEEQFKKLVGQMSKALPPELQGTFVEAAKEIKTIDGLSKLLNRMFTEFGDTLPYGYMILDYGGKDSVWLRMGADTKKALLSLGSTCLKSNRAMDDLLGGLIRMAAEGKLQADLDQLIADSPEVKNLPPLGSYDQVSDG